jgi:hypothetical protein
LGVEVTAAVAVLPRRGISARLLVVETGFLCPVAVVLPLDPGSVLFVVFRCYDVETVRASVSVYHLSKVETGVAPAFLLGVV